MHNSAMNYLRQTQQIYREYLQGPTLEVGSININGSARAVFSQYVPYTGVDIVPGPCVDEVVDIRDRQSAKEAELTTYKLIVSTEVLEHTEPVPLLTAMLDYADPAGCFFVLTCAGPNRRPHSADGKPDLKTGEYYANVSHETIINWLEQARMLGWTFENVHIAYNEDQTDLYINFAITRN